MRDRRSRKAEEEEGRRSRKSQPRDHCRASGCPNATHEHKPYCLDHIDRMRVAQEITAQLAVREKEEKRASRLRGWQKIVMNGTRAQEIVNHVAVIGGLT